MSFNKIVTISLGLSLLLNVFLLSTINNTTTSPTLAAAPTLDSSSHSSTQHTPQPKTDTSVLFSQFIESLLNEGNCESAATYLTHQPSDDIPASINQRWKQLVSTYISSHQYHQASTCLNAILDVFPYEPEFNWQLGELYRAEELYEEALAAFYAALPMSTDAAWRSEKQEELHKFVMQRYDSLHTNEDWQAIHAFFSNVISFDDSNVFYQLINAESLLHLAQYEESKIWLLPLTKDQQVGVRAQQLLAKIESRNMPDIVIPLQRIGEQYLISVNLDNQPATLLIDTGASISLLTERKYQEILGHTAPTFIKDTLLQTAGGTVSAPIYQYEKLQIADIGRTKPHFVVVELNDMKHFDGLLGMDFFRAFHFVIDQQKNQLLLSPIETTLAEAD